MSREPNEDGKETRSVTPWVDVRRRGVGHWAFLLHRITGVSLFAYLIFHVETVSQLLGGAQHYDAVVSSFETIPGFILIALIFAVGIFHGANGLRILLAQFDIGGRYHRPIFWTLVGVSIVCWIYIVQLIYTLEIVP